MIVCGWARVQGRWGGHSVDWKRDVGGSDGNRVWSENMICHCGGGLVGKCHDSGGYCTWGRSLSSSGKPSAVGCVLTVPYDIVLHVAG